MVVAKHIPINTEAKSPLPAARQPARMANIDIPADHSNGANIPAPTKPQKIGGAKLKKKRNGSAILGIPVLSRSYRCFIVLGLLKKARSRAAPGIGRAAAETSAHCGCTNRPTRPAAPL